VVSAALMSRSYPHAREAITHRRSVDDRRDPIVCVVASLNETARLIVDFLGRIGLPVRCEQIESATVLPGVSVDQGVLVVDADKLQWPGDLLHEAGHLAVLGSADRAAVTVDFGSDAGYEMAAIAWSWAALRALGLDPGVVFHQHGYRGGSSAVVENFAAGRYVGVPILEWRGLTAQGERAAHLGVEPYPAMLRWLAD
jgi:hypothetical protein